MSILKYKNIIFTLVLAFSIVAISYPAMKTYIDDSVASARFQAIGLSQLVESNLEATKKELAAQGDRLNNLINDLNVSLEAYQKVSNSSFSAFDTTFNSTIDRVEEAQTSNTKRLKSTIDDFNSGYTEIIRSQEVLADRISNLEEELEELKSDQAAENAAMIF